MLRALSNLFMLLSEICRPQQFTSVGFQKVAKTVQFTDFRCNTLQTPCRCVQRADDNFKMLRISPTCRFELQKAAKIASNLQA